MLGQLATCACGTSCRCAAVCGWAGWLWASVSRYALSFSPSSLPSSLLSPYFSLFFPLLSPSFLPPSSFPSLPLCPPFLPPPLSLSRILPPLVCFIIAHCGGGALLFLGWVPVQHSSVSELRTPCFVIWEFHDATVKLHSVVSTIAAILMTRSTST